MSNGKRRFCEELLIEIPSDKEEVAPFMLQFTEKPPLPDSYTSNVRSTSANDILDYDED